MTLASAQRSARRELALLLAALAVVAAAWLALAAAVATGAGTLQQLDERVLRGLRRAGDPARLPGPWWLPGAVRDVTALGSVAVLTLVALAAGGALALQRRTRMLGVLTAALAGGVGLQVALKALIGRPRPSAVPALVEVGSPSFPSGHAMLAAIVYLTAGALVARAVRYRALKLYVLAVAAALTLLVGLSRVALGVHYPSDVLAGWTAGLAWATGWWLVARRLQERGRLSGG